MRDIFGSEPASKLAGSRRQLRCRTPRLACGEQSERTSTILCRCHGAMHLRWKKTKFKNPGLSIEDQESALEDSPDSTSRIRTAESEIHNGQNRDDPFAPIENHQSKIENGPEPIQTPTSQIQNWEAALCGDPATPGGDAGQPGEGAGCPQEKVYAPSEKRSAANQANLLKAHAARAAAQAEKQAFSGCF